MPNIFEANALKTQHLDKLQVQVNGAWQQGEDVPIVGEFVSPYKIVEPERPSHLYHHITTPALIVNWQDATFSHHDPHINWTDANLSWEAAWPVSVNVPIETVSFTQGDYIPTYLYGNHEDSGSRNWTLVGMGIANGILTLHISLPNDHGSAWGQYVCHLTINGVEFSAIATLEFVLDGS